LPSTYETAERQRIAESYESNRALQLPHNGTKFGSRRRRVRETDHGARPSERNAHNALDSQRSKSATKSSPPDVGFAELRGGIAYGYMQAMALRRPVISTFVAGIPELVVPGEHGWLVPAGDTAALAAAMRACLNFDADAIARMGSAAQARVLERHDADREAAKLADLFRQ
jgi:hypothetical protein